MYQINNTLSMFIDSDTINQIAELDYSFLGVKDPKPKNFDLSFGDFLLSANFRYTPIGYFATTIDLIIQKNNVLQREYKGIWGFSIKETEGKRYIIILSMKNISPIAPFNLEVLDLDTFELIYEEYIEPIEQFY